VQDVPKFVLKRLQETADAESHPDADLLTAFTEHSLLESERARVLEHLARCADCREVVAFALPASEDVAVNTSTAPARGGWSGWPILRWGVVAAGIVTITSVGILQYRLHHPKPATLDAVLMPRNDKTATEELALQPPSAPAPAPAPAPSQSQEIRPQTQNEYRADARKKTQSNRQDTLAIDNSARVRNQISPAPRSGRAVGSGVAGGVASGFVRAQAPAHSVLVPSPDVAQQAAASSSAQTVEVESQAAAAAPAPERQLSDQLAQNQTDQSLKYTSSTNLLDGKASPRWSISSDGKLQHSVYDGQTWVETDVDPESAVSRSNLAGTAGNTNEVVTAKKSVKKQRSPSATFRALAAFGSEVWAGGSAAMLYHSTDSGAHWTRVRPSLSGVALTGDITSIDFSDPQHGTIATSTGEAWITTDAGQTWLRQ